MSVAPRSQLVLASIVAHVLVLLLLAQRKASLGHGQTNSKTVQSHLPIAAALIRLAALLSAVLGVISSYAFEDASVDPLLYAFVRVVVFFYSCKALDLAVRAENPPTKLRYINGVRIDQPCEMTSKQDKLAYAWALLTEMRYASFDIRAVEPGRNETSRLRRLDFMNGVSLALLAWMANSYGFLFAPLKAVMLLFILRIGLEGIHVLAHPYCSEPQFYEPFSARTLTEFWGRRWHAAASPFLLTLAYKPVRKATGSRALGVLATFALSGVWHAWVAAAAVERRWQLGMEIFALFMLFGFGILAEKAFWRERQASYLQGVIVWNVCLHAAGWCWNTLECSTTVPWLRNETSCRRWVY